MTSESDAQAGPRHAVKVLYDTSNMLASCHSILCDRYRTRNSWLMSAILVLSTFSVGTTFMSDEFVRRTVGISADGIKWINGLASIFTFGAGLLLSQWDLASKAADHRTAVRHYFAVLNQARSLLRSDADITQETVEELRSQYQQTEALPKIPDADFLRLKQKHLRKVAISRELDKSAHLSLREIRKRLRETETR